MTLVELKPNTKLDPVPENSNFDALRTGEDMHYNAAWTTYTPLWNCLTTAPALVDGTLNGRYLKLGRTVILRIFWKAGASTTFGTGAWEFSLPFRQAASYGTDGQQTSANRVYISDATGSDYSGQCRLNALNRYIQIYVKTMSGTYATATAVTNLVPFTFATTDFISLLYIYETDQTGDY